MNDVTNTYISMNSPQLKEFSFTIGSPMPTPSKRSKLLSSPTRLRPMISNSTFVSLKKPLDSIHTKRSNLDMLDQQLTSFPLAPPPPKEDSSQLLKSPEFNAQDPPSKTNSIFESTAIVLVEDYIKPKRLGRKKLSVADLKTSLRAFEPESEEICEEDAQGSYLRRAKSILSMNATQKLAKSVDSKSSSLLLTMSHLHNDDAGNMTETASHSSVHTKVIDSSLSSLHSLHSLTTSIATLKLSEAVNVPLAEFSVSQESSLKYCVICDAPLYEISSHLVSCDKMFNEFVCCNCTERYEVLSRLLEDFEQTISGMSTIPEDVEDIEEALNQPALKRRKNDDFSKTLVDRLKRHLNGESPEKEFNTIMDRRSAMWLLEAKRKLRWRWRISGLLPRFIKRNEWKQ
jgi:hypothetical protein